jgi:hypothetical protein
LQKTVTTLQQESEKSTNLQETLKSNDEKLQALLKQQQEWDAERKRLQTEIIAAAEAHSSTSDALAGQIAETKRKV